MYKTRGHLLPAVNRNHSGAGAGIMRVMHFLPQEESCKGSWINTGKVSQPFWAYLAVLDRGRSFTWFKHSVRDIIIARLYFRPLYDMIQMEWKQRTLGWCRGWPCSRGDIDCVPNRILPSVHFRSTLTRQRRLTLASTPLRHLPLLRHQYRVHWDCEVSIVAVSISGLCKHTSALVHLHF